jgi:glycosyltransferase involved in cell wall biosynthesis
MSSASTADLVSLRYLAGPISGSARWRRWQTFCQEGQCRTFDPGGKGLRLAADEGWAQLSQRLPPGWQPDFLVLHLAASGIPPRLLLAPVPIVGLAEGWDLHWHRVRQLAPFCDLILSDPAGAACLRQAGWSQAAAARLVGYDPALPEVAPESGQRDIDLLWLGEAHPAFDRGVLPWLGRLARQSARWHVCLGPRMGIGEYGSLLARARIVFTHSRQGGCDAVLLDAARAGALVFYEAANLQTPLLLRPGQEAIAYSSGDLEAQLEQYLSSEEQRCAVAAAGQERVRQLSFGSGWQEALAHIQQAWPLLQERVAERSRRMQGKPLPWTMRTWLELNSTSNDWTLAPELSQAVQEKTKDAGLHHALGLAVTMAQIEQGQVTGSLAASVCEHFQRALACEPLHVTAAVSLIEALVGCQRWQLAADGARQMLALLEQGPRLSPAVVELPPFPPGWSVLRVEWERCAWTHAGDSRGEVDAKGRLLRWRLHTLLGELTGEGQHFQQAAQARPDLAPAQAQAGLALAKSRQPQAAIDCLRRAVSGNPFDAASARLLHAVLHEAGDHAAARFAARERRWLAQAAPDLLRPEAWFQQAAPVGDEPVSIVVPCHNQVDLTRLCLESVLAHSRAPVEIVVVDNGSSDGTQSYLRALQPRSPGVPIRVIRNESNLGFPVACNQGWQVARGDYVVFLNNDTVVTAGWLERMLGVLLHDWPRVGLVGPMTNNARPPQEIAVSYRSLEELPAFAEQLHEQHKGKALEVERLSGFCLLTTRRLLEQVGGLDERYGIGLFDDDDLCVKALEAGHRLRVALDAFVHHFGSRTFVALDVDMPARLAENFAAFHAKWGSKHSAGYRLRDGAAPVPAAANGSTTRPASGRRQRVSLCLIVKNEEDNLPACLQSAADLVDEVIVVDTGSSDNTRQVAEQMGARVFDFPWCDSFAAARNESLRHASGEWIMWLDADDQLDETNREKLRQLFAHLPEDNVCYSMKCVCLPEAGGPATVVDHIRLFRNHPQIRWRYRVHEQILLAVRALNGRVAWSDVQIHHTGYQDPALRKRKLERDLRLLHREDEEHPDDPFTMFNLGSTYQEKGEPARAIPYLQRSLQRSHPQDSIVRKLYSLLLSCHRRLQQSEQALAACLAGRSIYPDDVELLFAESILCQEQGDRQGARRCLQHILTIEPGQHFASVDAGLRTYKARHNLAVLEQQEGRTAEAEALWQAVVAERPDFVPGWLGLGEVALGRSDGQQLEAIACRLETLPQGPMEAALLRARASLAGRDFTVARDLLEQAIASFPQAVPLRVLLSQVLLQEGTDLAAAEQALHEVLALEPQHAGAQHNLEVLWQQRQQAIDWACAESQVQKILCEYRSSSAALGVG